MFFAVPLVLIEVSGSPEQMIEFYDYRNNGPWCVKSLADGACYHTGLYWPDDSAAIREWLRTHGFRQGEPAEEYRNG